MVPFYTPREREELVRWLGRHGFNLYVYGPKNDRHHRRTWREPYPAQFMGEFARVVAAGREAGVAVCYALSPSAGLVHSSAEDFAAITGKLHAFYNIGVRAFGLFFDDITPQFADARDGARYGGYGEAHADLCNRTLEWLQALDPSCRLTMCPTEYHGAPPFGRYLQELGAHLRPEIGVFYTGPGIVSPQIMAADAAAFAGVVGRPPLIWDNYPVNDLAMQPELHIGPVRGREAGLVDTALGVAANLMLQPEASKIALHTFASYFAEPHGYDPETAWAEALVAVAGEEGAGRLRLLAENSLRSYLGTPEAARYTALAAAAANELEAAAGVDESAAARQLEGYLQAVDEACYYLRHYLPNLALRREIQPWSERLAAWAELGSVALGLLRADEAGQRDEGLLRRWREVQAELARGEKRIAEEALAPLLAVVRARVGEAA
jgi:hyaluronoglucosaminidase